MSTDYPKEWERHLTLRDGRAAFIRPIRPEDEALYPAFMAAVSPEDARFRFFGPVKEFNRAVLTSFTHVDYVSAMAFIALDEATGEMLGVARLHDKPGGRAAEFAIIVRSDVKGRGLGWQLMRLTVDYGRSRGLGAIEGQVQHDNKAMLKMCQELGFDIAMDAKDASLSKVTLALARQA
jgi:RimJ/RimL family protein N-acetyltransferase